jgi:hypothetical protein
MEEDQGQGSKATPDVRQDSVDRDDRSHDGGEANVDRDPTGKPTVDEPTGPALDPGSDDFDKQAEEQASS